MSYFNVFTQEVAAIILFFYSIENFSKLIFNANTNRIKAFFAKYSNTRIKALSIGIIATLILQSSTAVSTLAVSLVNATMLNVATAMQIIFGASIGTSSTAFLVSLKVKWIEEVVIIVSFLINILTKKKTVAKVVFYLGLLLFSIEQMSLATSVLKDSPLFKYIFLNIENTYILFFLGIFLTIILQSSTLMTSILVVLILQDGIVMKNALIICIGAFVGTTLTALVVSLKMNAQARKIGIYNSIISLIAGFINIAFIDIFVSIGNVFKNPGFGLALGNTCARIFCAILSLIIFEIFMNRSTVFNSIKKKVYKKVTLAK